MTFFGLKQDQDLENQAAHPPPIILRSTPQDSKQQIYHASTVWHSSMTSKEMFRVGFRCFQDLCISSLQLKRKSFETSHSRSLLLGVQRTGLMDPSLPSPFISLACSSTMLLSGEITRTLAFADVCDMLNT